MLRDLRGEKAKLFDSFLFQGRRTCQVQKDGDNAIKESQRQREKG